MNTLMYEEYLDEQKELAIEHIENALKQFSINYKYTNEDLETLEEIIKEIERL